MSTQCMQLRQYRNKIYKDVSAIQFQRHVHLMYLQVFIIIIIIFFFIFF